MEFKIDNQGQRVDIKVTDLADKQAELLAAFQQCQAGTCSCPTDEYTKVDSIDIQTNLDDIHLILNLQSGKEVASAKINDCLHYTEQQIQSKK